MILQCCTDHNSILSTLRNMLIIGKCAIFYPSVVLYQNYIKKYFIALNGKTILMLEKVCIYKFRYKSHNAILLNLSRFL